MKIGIYGAGAIGGYLGVQPTRAGADVSLVARGAHLAAMRERGLKLLIGDEQHVVRPRCTDNPAELGRLTQIPTPALDAVLGLVAQRAKIAGLYEGNVRPAKEKIPVFA
jgi:ketopantoate reductase